MDDWGAHASRVRVRASCPNHRGTNQFGRRVFGATPKTATGTVALPAQEMAKFYPQISQMTQMGRKNLCNRRNLRMPLPGRALRNSQFEMVRASFPVFSLGWTIGGSARVPRAGSGVAPEPFVEPFRFGNQVFGATPKTATGTVALPITDGSRSPQFAIRNSQFEIVRASFPVFILGWTFGAIGV